MAWAVGGREGLTQVAALAQGDAVLKARATFRCALKGAGGEGVRTRFQKHNEQKRAVSFTIYLRPVQSDPLWWAGLIVAGLLFDRPVSETVGVLQCLLLSRADLPDTKDRPCPYPTITCPPTLRPVTNKPPETEKTDLKQKNQSWQLCPVLLSVFLYSPCEYLITHRLLVMSV